jgi:phosphatidylglycerol:prolipoprotein diacylglycerol transferase
MFPKLIDLGTVDLPFFGEVALVLPSYGVLFALAAVLSWSWFVRRGRTLGIAEERLFNLTFYTLLAGLLGAKLLLVLLDLPFYLSNPRELLGSIRSAGVLIGGVIGGTVLFIFYCRKHDLPVFKLGDAIAAPLAFGQAIGRLGCFSAGCCFGKPMSADSPFALIFTNPYAHDHTGVPLNIPLIPVQLIQFAADLILAGVLTLLWRKRIAPAGTVFWAYLIFYGLSRGSIEYLRGDVGRGVWIGGMLSTSQLLAIVGIVFGLIMWLRGRSRPEVDAT